MLDTDETQLMTETQLDQEAARLASLDSVCPPIITSVEDPPAASLN